VDAAPDIFKAPQALLIVTQVELAPFSDQPQIGVAFLFRQIMLGEVLPSFHADSLDESRLFLSHITLHNLGRNL